MGEREGVAGAGALARVVLRPIANPFPLGFLGLAAATFVLSGQELHWIPAGQSPQVAVAILASAPVLQLVACVFGFLGRDPVAATGMGILSATWGVAGVVHLISLPGARSQVLGTFLFVASAGVALGAVTAAETKALPAAVMATTAARFFVTGLYELIGGGGLDIAAGAIGCLLAALATYAAFALELEGSRHHTVLPTFRRGRGKRALFPALSEQLGSVAAEPGVRNQL